MNAADLKKYGLKQVARVHIEGKDLKIKTVDLEAAKLTECIYAFLIEGKVVRVGSSKAPLENRLRDYERDITNALNGKNHRRRLKRPKNGESCFRPENQALYMPVKDGRSRLPSRHFTLIWTKKAY